MPSSFVTNLFHCPFETREQTILAESQIIINIWRSWTPNLCSFATVTIETSLLVSFSGTQVIVESALLNNSIEGTKLTNF